MSEKTALSNEAYDTAGNVYGFIKLINNKDTKGEYTQTDTIYCGIEESLTLEYFSSLILNARKSNKDFILAKVMTLDPNDNSKFFCFYYSAYQFNKLIFRYDEQLELLHQLRVKNPLNNMDVCDRISYYRISPPEVDEAIKKFISFSGKLESVNTVEFPRKEQHAVEDESLTTFSEKDIVPKEKVPENEQHETMPQSREDSKHLVYEMIYFANNDDFMKKSEVREYFRRQATSPDEPSVFVMSYQEHVQNTFFPAFSDGIHSTTVSNSWKVEPIYLVLALVLFVLIVMTVRFSPQTDPTGLVIALSVIVLSIVSFVCWIVVITDADSTNEILI